jgi:uncharacterized protein YecE (DUF72 family)
MELFIGTSGYRYKDWDNGVFYPRGIKDRLAYLMERVNAVEINASFYNIPAPETVARWGQAMPGDARLVLKAPRSVSHRRRLKLESEGGVAQGRDLLLYFIRGCIMIPESNRGPVLLQLPESMKVSLERLDKVLALFGENGLRVAVEVRHESWLADDTYALLSRHRSALVATQWKLFHVPLTATADFAYVRYHGPDPLNPYRGSYPEDRLKSNLEDILDTGLKEAYIFFNNDYDGCAVRNAMTMLGLSRELGGR